MKQIILAAASLPMLVQKNGGDDASHNPEITH